MASEESVSTTPVSVRLSADLRARVHEESSRLGVSLSTYIAEAIEQRLSAQRRETVQLESQLHYLATVAATAKRQTLLTFIEQAIEDELKTVSLYRYGEEHKSSGEGSSVEEESVAAKAHLLWYPDPYSRLMALQDLYPNLVPPQQQEIWRLIRATPGFWKDAGDGARQLNRSLIRKHWTLLEDIAAGRTEEKSLKAVK